MRISGRIAALTMCTVLVAAMMPVYPVSAGNVEETEGIRLQTLLFDNSGTNLWTSESWGGANIIPNHPRWTTTDISDYYYNGQLSFEVKSNGEEQLSFKMGLSSKSHAKDVTIYWTNMEAYQGKIIAGTDWTSYTLPVKELIDANPDSGFDISNLWRVYVTGVKKPETISFRNMKLTSPDDERQYPFIKVNQVGYSVNGAKTARISYFAKFGSLDGKQYEIVEKETGKTVLTGTLSPAELNEHLSGESVHIIQFDELKTPGTYCIRVPETGFSSDARSPLDAANGLETDTLVSCAFQIGDHIYDSLLTDMMRYYYYQRQGIDLDAKYAGDFAHADLHPNDIQVKKWSDRNNPDAETFDVSQGWYDAGDYGKYTSTGVNSVENLLLAYDLFPEVCKNMTISIPENDKTNTAYVDAPGYLSEVKWEIDMLLKLEHADRDGSFYVAANYKDDTIYLEDTLYSTSDYTSDSSETDLRSHLATSDMAAMLAHAYIIYKDIPAYADFADQCLNTAVRAWDWVNDPANPQHPSIGAANRTYTYTPEELDRSMYWAAGALYRAAKSAGINTAPYETYLLENCETENVCKCFTGSSAGYSNHGRSFLGFFHYLYQNTEADAKIKEVFGKFEAWRKRMLKLDNWGTDYPDWGYWWGSNNVIAQSTMTLLLGSILTEGENSIPDEVILSNESAFNYMLGVNPISFSYVSGHGENCVQNIYSAIYSKDARLEPYRCPAGYVTEGTNPTNNRQLSKFDGKCYMDSDAEYTTNENTIYGNAAMILLTSAIMSRIGTSSAGDVNADGAVNAEDARILRDYLIGESVKLNAENADMNADRHLDARDLSLLKQKLLMP